MSQREIIEMVAAYSSGSAATTEEDFYKLQSLLSNGEISAVSTTHSTELKEVVPVKSTTEYDSNQIAGMFSEELKQLRDDPEFTGTASQVAYLKEILAADKLLTKNPY